MAEATELSPATINRQVTALTRLGLVTERPDLVHTGGIGRPKNPLTIDRERMCVAGMHIGARRTLLAIADLGGRTLYSHAVLTPEGPGEDAARRLCEQLAELAHRFSGRRLLWGGVAIGGSVDSDSGVVDHDVLGWRRVPVAAMLASTLGVPVSVVEHVQAMAAAELLLTYPRSPEGTGLFFYARETVGLAMTFDGKVHVPTRGAGTIAHVPVDVEYLASGTVALQDVIGESAQRNASERLGLNENASILVDERAAVLGRVVALLRDVINPDSVVVAGDAFGAHPHGLAPVQAAFDAATATAWPLELEPCRFGLRVQESAAVVVALSVIYADPTVVGAA